jgi:hypothetical protein
MNTDTIKDGTYLKTENGLSPINAKTGYWVGIEETTLEEIETNETIGIWKDENGKLWIDKVVRLTDLSQAILLAKTFLQKAIYDIANNKVITLNKTTN